MKRFAVHDRNFLGVISVWGIYICLLHIPKAEPGKKVEAAKIFPAQRSHFPPTAAGGTGTGRKTRRHVEGWEPQRVPQPCPGPLLGTQPVLPASLGQSRSSPGSERSEHLDSADRGKENAPNQSEYVWQAQTWRQRGGDGAGQVVYLPGKDPLFPGSY